MGAQLNIMSENAYRLASRLAEPTGETRIEIVPFTSGHAREARRARGVYGKPHHPARPNFGDRLAYGVASQERAALLFKGNAFSRTDIEPALKD